MAFLGIFGKQDGLTKLKIEEVRKSLRELELDEARLGRRASIYRERKESIEDYIRREPYISDDEMVQFALDVTELEHDIAAQNDQLSRVRDEKRAVKGILILKEREARLKRGGVWSVITKMGPEQLQESLIKLGDADASATQTVEDINVILGAPISPREMRRQMTASERRKLDELTAMRGGGVRPTSRPEGGVTPGGTAPITPGPTGRQGDFYVYEDDPTNRARVHRGECRYCNYGKGLRGQRDPNNRWRGPYPTSESAFDFARSLRKKDTAGCGVCNP